LALLAAPLFLLVIEFLRGALYETDVAGKQALGTAVQSLEAKALQYGEGLQTLIAAHEAAGVAWPQIRQQPWFTDYWSRIELVPGRDLYAAVVDDSGTIVMHTNAGQIGKRLGRGWYQKKISGPESDVLEEPDVVWAEHSPMSGDRAAYDASTSLTAAGTSLGEYHHGVASSWVDSQVQAQRSTVMRRWAWVLLLIGGVDSAAIGALAFLARGQRRSSTALAATGIRRAKELSQLGAGLAHEVRNPLHALRINLHTLKRAIGGRLLPEEQLVATIEESDEAIDRLDSLMRDFLQFADPSGGEREEVDVIQTLRTTLILLSENLRRDNIQLRSNLPPRRAVVSMNPLRLKQLLMNVLTFAENRVGDGGKIEINAAILPDAVEVTVGDNGPPIAGEQKTQLFEPFQAPVETGSGLGLALVHVFAEEVGGNATWEGDGTDGGCCRVRLPLATPH